MIKWQKAYDISETISISFSPSLHSFVKYAQYIYIYLYEQPYKHNILQLWSIIEKK